VLGLACACKSIDTAPPDPPLKMEEPAALAGAHGLEGKTALEEATLEIAPPGESAKPTRPVCAAAKTARRDRIRRLLQQVCDRVGGRTD